MTFLPLQTGPGGWALPGGPVWRCWILPDAANSRAWLEEIIPGCAFNRVCSPCAAVSTTVSSGCRARGCWADALPVQRLSPSPEVTPFTTSNTRATRELLSLVYALSSCCLQIKMWVSHGTNSVSLNKAPDLKQFIMGEVLMWNKQFLKLRSEPLSDIHSIVLWQNFQA